MRQWDFCILAIASDWLNCDLFGHITYYIHIADGNFEDYYDIADDSDVLTAERTCVLTDLKSLFEYQCAASGDAIKRLFEEPIPPFNERIGVKFFPIWSTILEEYMYADEVKEKEKTPEDAVKSSGGAASTATAAATVGSDDDDDAEAGAAAATSGDSDDGAGTGAGAASGGVSINVSAASSTKSSKTSSYKSPTAAEYGYDMDDEDDSSSETDYYKDIMSE